MIVFTCAGCATSLTLPVSQVALPAHAHQQYGAHGCRRFVSHGYVRCTTTCGAADPTSRSGGEGIPLPALLPLPATRAG